MLSKFNSMVRRITTFPFLVQALVWDRTTAKTMKSNVNLSRINIINYVNSNSSIFRNINKTLSIFSLFFCRDVEWMRFSVDILIKFFVLFIRSCVRNDENEELKKAEHKKRTEKIGQISAEESEHRWLKQCAIETRQLLVSYRITTMTVHQTSSSSLSAPQRLIYRNQLTQCRGVLSMPKRSIYDESKCCWKFGTYISFEYILLYTYQLFVCCHWLVRPSERSTNQITFTMWTSSIDEAVQSNCCHN